MNSSKWSRIVRFLALGVLAGLGPACSAGPPEYDRSSTASGTLSVPLTVTAGTHTYRFSRFQLLIYPEYSWLSSSGDPDETMLRIDLPTGFHDAYLYDWALEQDDGSGEYRPVNASLISSYWVQFEVLNGSTTTISFQFETNGQVVTVGAGSLAVTAGVTELPAVCAAFSNDCGEGFWCPPSGLTGAYLECRPAGALELGASCNNPSECPASSTCAELDSSPTCVGLCESSDFEQPCAGGGTCQPVSDDYGVCVPSTASSE